MFNLRNRSFLKELDFTRDELAFLLRLSASLKTAKYASAHYLDELPETFTTKTGKHTVVGYPALVDEGSSVAIRVLPDEQQAVAAHTAGVRRLLLLGTTPPWKRVLARLTNAQKLALADNPHGSVPKLLDDALAAAVDDIVTQHVTGPVRTRAAPNCSEA